MNRWNEEIGRSSGGWLIAALACAILAAAPAYPGLGISNSHDMTMVFLGLAGIALAIASLLSRRLSNPPSVSTLAILGALLTLHVSSGLASQYRPLALYGTPVMRFGLITVLPLLALGLLALPFRREFGMLLRQATPWVFGAWMLAAAYQAVDKRWMPWGLSSNNALTAQVLLLLLPAFLTIAGSRRVLRALVSLAVAGYMWWVSSSIGVGLALLWAVADALLGKHPALDLSKVLRWAPFAHLLLTLAAVTATLLHWFPESLMGGRTRMWLLAIQVISSRPLVGVGPDAFRWASAPLLSDSTAQVLYDSPSLSVSAHSLWLDVAAVYGIVGLIIIFVSALAIARAWPGRVDAPALPFVAGLLLYSVTLLVQPVGLQTLPLLLLVLSASLARGKDERAVQLGDEEQRHGRPLFALATIPLSLVVCAFGLTCVSVGRPEFHPASLATTESAARFWRYEPELWAQAGYRYGMSIGTSPNPMAAIGGMQASLERAIALVPLGYQYRIDLARASDQLGLDSSLVRKRYDEALATFPLSAEINYDRGLFLAAQGDVSGARESYALLLRLYPDWSGTSVYQRRCESLGIQVP